jgi:glutamate carboxypeptidase
MNRIADAERITRRTLDRLRGLVAAESPSGDPEAIARIAGLLADAFREAGGEVEQRPVPGLGVHLIARFGGRAATERPVLVLGHMDTVHPLGTIAERPFRVEDGRAWGPGSYDMKAGLAVAAEALLRLRDGGGPRRPVTLLVTCDEEIGSGTSRELIEQLALESSHVLVPEPPLAGGGAKTSRKGVGVYELDIRGVAAHAGIEPEKGVSAIAELAHQTLRVLALARPEAGSTLNIGRITGGTAGNVVAEHAWAEIDVRFATMTEAERLDAALRALEPVLACRIEVSGGVNRPPLERSEGVVGLFTLAARLAEQLGFELTEGGTGGGSDGSFTAAVGVPTLDGLGVDGAGAHADNEHILVEDVPRRVALMQALLESL